MKKCSLCNVEKALTEFPTDKRCPDGRRNKCRSCTREYHTRWRQDNPDLMSAMRKRDRTKNQKQRRVYNALWYQENKKHTNEVRRRWRKRNVLKWRAYAHQRTARQYDATGYASPEAIEARMSFYGYRCYMCRGAFDQIEHVIPLSRGGTNWPANLRPACRSCNARKHTKLPRELAA